MKIAFPTSGNDLMAPLDSRFGRAAKFLIFDSDNKSFEIVDNNQNFSAAQGAGIQSAQNVVNAGAKAVIANHCGPKAFKVLMAAGVCVYNCEAVTISEAIEQYDQGKLKLAEGADVVGHWGQV